MDILSQASFKSKQICFPSMFKWMETNLVKMKIKCVLFVVNTIIQNQVGTQEKDLK